MDLLHIASLVFIAIVVLIVFYFQIGVKNELSQLMVKLRNLMPNINVYTPESLRCVDLGGDEEIMEQIDRYIAANEAVAPNFSIIKDIVERGSNEIDEQIRTLLSMPLYYGLCGTIAGIIAGLIPVIFGAEDLMANISPLLLGVAIAMAGSFSGVLITSYTSKKYKETIRKLEAGKRAFFNWFQVVKLPVLGNDPSGPIGQLIRSLSGFHKEFSKSASIMASTASGIAETFEMQGKLLELMKDVNQSNLAKKNVEMAQQMTQHVDVVRSFNSSIIDMQSYVTKLQTITSELQNSTQYLKVVQDLVEILNGERQAISHATGGLTLHINNMYEKQQTLTNNSLEAVKEQNEIVVQKFIAAQDMVIQKIQNYFSQNATIPAAFQEMAKLPESLMSLKKEISSLGDSHKAVINCMTSIDTQLRNLSGKIDLVEKKTVSSPHLNEKRGNSPEKKTASVKPATEISENPPITEQTIDSQTIKGTEETPASSIPKSRRGFWEKIRGVLKKD